MQNILEITFNFPTFIEDETDVVYINQTFKLSDYTGDNYFERFIRAVNRFYSVLGCNCISNNFDKKDYVVYINDCPTVGLDEIGIDLAIMFNELSEKE